MQKRQPIRQCLRRDSGRGRSIRSTKGHYPEATKEAGGEAAKQDKAAWIAVGCLSAGSPRTVRQVPWVKKLQAQLLGSWALQPTVAEFWCLERNPLVGVCCGAEAWAGGGTLNRKGVTEARCSKSQSMSTTITSAALVCSPPGIPCR